MEVSCRVLHKAFSCRLLHVILICKSLHVRRLPWIPFPSPRRAKLASTCARHASHRESPVRPSLKKPVFRSACSHRSSWEMPPAFDSTSYWRSLMLSDWRSPLKGISSKRITSNQPTFRMPICKLAAPPDAIALNVLIIATVVVPPFRLLQMSPLHPHSTTRSSPISPCPISESRLPQTHLAKPSPKGNSQWPEHHFGPLFAAYLRERSRKMRTVLSALPTIMTMTGQPYRPTYPYRIAHTDNRS